MELKEARRLAEAAKEKLAPHCLRIEIAGSVRRGKPECGDIDLVVIPRRDIVKEDLFDDKRPERISAEYVKAVEQWDRVKGKADGKYTRRELGSLAEGAEDAEIDIYAATPENWGLILAIRTGSAEFNVKLMIPWLKAAGYQVEDGVLWLGGERVSVPEEQDLFKLAKLGWVEPRERL
jgi:DNA polymerase/3'-5' exonuclease PolX